MKEFNYKNTIAYAMVFQQQIRKAQMEYGGSDWTWESYLPGPMSREEAELVMGIAGCWCYDLSEENVKFYTNNNHPKWSGVRHSFY